MRGVLYIMNLNISEETIEIGGKEYKLFLNRKAIINWEHITHATELQKKYQNIISEISKDVEINDDTNPFEIDTEAEELDTMLSEVEDIYSKIVLNLFEDTKLDDIKNIDDYSNKYEIDSNFIDKNTIEKVKEKINSRKDQSQFKLTRYDFSCFIYNIDSKKSNLSKKNRIFIYINDKNIKRSFRS